MNGMTVKNGDGLFADSPRQRLWLAIVLCLPSIIGTAFFLIGLLMDSVGSQHTFEPLKEPSITDRVYFAVVWQVYGGCYLGAAFGPLLVPFAGCQAMALARGSGRRSQSTLMAWSAVLTALVATAILGGRLSHMDIFV